MRAARQHKAEAIRSFFTFMMIGVLCSIAWWQRGFSNSDIADRIGLLFFLGIHWFIFPMFGSINSCNSSFTLFQEGNTCLVIPEKGIVRKERASGMYSLFIYFTSKFSAEFLIDLVTPIAFCCLV